MENDVAVGLDRLARFENRDGGWGYSAGQDSAVEPTAATILAHLAHSALPPERGLVWLERAQLADGSWGLNAASDESSWVTAWALWALAFAGRRGGRLERGAAWLAAVPVISFDDPETAPAMRRLLEVDPGATGWPWQPGEASWVTPTSIAVIAMCWSGLRDHPRLAQARWYLADRACSSGGWNFGNPVMLGRPIPPLVTDTGIALLALRQLGVPASDADVAGGLGWLGQVRPEDAGALDRAWACLGNGVWGRDVRLADAVRQDIRGKSRQSPGVTVLALAVGLMALAPVGRLLASVS